MQDMVVRLPDAYDSRADWGADLEIVKESVQTVKLNNFTITDSGAYAVQAASRHAKVMSEGPNKHSGSDQKTEAQSMKSAGQGGMPMRGKHAKVTSKRKHADRSGGQIVTREAQSVGGADTGEQGSLGVGGVIMLLLISLSVVAMSIVAVQPVASGVGTWLRDKGYLALSSEVAKD